MFALHIKDIYKSFSHKDVLKGLSLSFYAGEIHSLLGENGAGKSTLVSILSGSVQPDSGTIVYDADFKKHTRKNIAVVHQNPRITSLLSVQQNIVLGKNKNRFLGIINSAADKKQILKLCKEWNISIDLNAKPQTATEKFYTALLSALINNPHMLILDEPSALLDSHQKNEFYDALENARKNGLCVLLITHSIQEALEHSTKISILNHGILMRTFNTPPETEQIHELMFSKSDVTQENQHNIRIHLPHAKNKTFLYVKNLCVNTNGFELINAEFKAYASDITVIHAKNDGSLLVLEDILTGTAPSSLKFDATFYLHGKTYKKLTPSILRKEKTALIPSKKIRASHPEISVYELLIPYTDLNADFAQTIIKQENIDINLKEPVSNLSGGMLQRLILARELAQKPKMLIFAEPTVGLDKNALNKFMHILRNVADTGCAVLILTTDITTIEHFCDTIYRIKNGHIKIQP